LEIPPCPSWHRSTLVGSGSQSLLAASVAESGYKALPSNCTRPTSPHANTSWKANRLQSRNGQKDLGVILIGRVRAIAFDKTGTLTMGKLSLCKRLAECNFVGTKVPSSDTRLLQVAAALESLSEHPIARRLSNLLGSSRLNGRGMNVQVGWAGDYRRNVAVYPRPLAVGQIRSLHRHNSSNKPVVWVACEENR